MKHDAAMTDEYPRDGMPLLKDAIELVRTNDAPVRILIRAGASRYWFGKRQLRRVHANIKYRDGREIFRSKGLTDELLNARVAKIQRDPEHGTVGIFVFMPYGRYKAREGHYADPRPDHAISWAEDAVRYRATDPANDDDELPF